MTYKKLLIYYLLEKNKILSLLSTEVYLLDKDFEFVENVLTEQWCKDYLLKKLRSGSDSFSCPWCVFFENDCSKCTYGNSYHRCCNHCGSSYKKITTDIQKILGEYAFISTIPVFRDLVNRIKLQAEEKNE